MLNLGQHRDDSGQESGRGSSSERTIDSQDPIDAEGVPILEPVSGWLDLFDPAGPIDPRASRWLQAVLRFSRADGSAVFDPRGRSTTRLRALAAWTVRVGDPSLAAVISRWSPTRATSGSAASLLPLASYSCPDRPLAMLRADWTPGGDLVAIDHRRVGDETLLEVAARGRTFLGPSWTSNESTGKFTRARPSHWSSTPFADFAEWTYKLGPKRVTRSAVLLRGRSMALLGQQDDGIVAASEVRFELGEGIEATPIEGSRAIQLTSGRGQPTARLLPLGLPSHDRSTDLGSIAIEGRQVVIRQVGEGRRRWLPVLICWGKAPTTWRPLTVAFRSKICRGDSASAVRVAWGPRDEGLVIYRSLASPALRSFLGHQSSSRFLVGGFTRSGEVRAILKVDA
jgi:hypothetical protein